jgi:hypothetical protein
MDPVENERKPFIETCDWCDSDMKDIGPSTTGSGLILKYHVYVCTKDGCGHEDERRPLFYRGSFAKFAEDE